MGGAFLEKCSDNGVAVIWEEAFFEAFHRTGSCYVCYSEQARNDPQFGTLMIGPVMDLTLFIIYIGHIYIHIYNLNKTLKILFEILWYRYFFFYKKKNENVTYYYVYNKYKFYY